MQIVIDIPEKTANEIKGNAMFAGTIPSEILWDITSAIVNGTPLPKGHGRIVDGDIVLTWLIYKGVIGKLKCGEVASVFEKATIIEADGGDAE